MVKLRLLDLIEESLDLLDWHPSRFQERLERTHHQHLTSHALSKNIHGDRVGTTALSIALPTKARFQIFTSGIAARHTFLIDTDSGKTWTLVTNKQEQPDGTMQELYSWQPFSD